MDLTQRCSLTRMLSMHLQQFLDHVADLVEPSAREQC